MQISDRLKLVVDFVEPCEAVADIGTDHGYVPIALVQQGKAKRAYAMDINKGPLERAREHIAEEGLSEKIETRLSDGMEKLNENEADTVVIAGMGGELTIGILQRRKEVLKTIKTLVLSPHSEVFLVREYLCANQYKIVREEMILDAGKYYTIMKAEKCAKEQEPPYEHYEYMYGRLLIQQKSSVLRQYLEDKRGKFVRILSGLEGQNSESSCSRREEIVAEVSEIDQVLEKL